MMLKIHKTTSKSKLLTRSIIASICIVSGLLGLSLLTYTPELSHAESVVSPEPKPDLSTITYMQDITQEICANTREADANGNYQYQLVDKRDGKTYWVAKLKDGNCWMTQNLAYDDGASSFSMPSTWGIDNAARKYYNPGLYVYTTPTTQNNCGTSGITSLGSCTSKGWVNVAGWTASDDPNYTGVADAANKTYNAHYSAGNYYSYVAATAGTAPSAAGTATSSICPKGWQSPTSNNTNSKSFGGLFAAYGSLSGLTAGTQDIRLAPLYFVYGGFANGSTLYGAGIYGRYWSSTAYNDTQAYSLYFYAGVHPSYNYLRLFGYSVRCVASGGEKSIDDNVEITVNPTITLDVTNEVEVKKSESNPSMAELDVKVTSNQGYSVQINAKDHAELTSNTTDVKIPSASGALNGSNNAWGIKKPGETEFTKVTTAPQLFYQSTVAEIKTIPFIIGISTAPDIPNGEYSTDITITATQN